MHQKLILPDIGFHRPGHSEGLLLCLSHVCIGFCINYGLIIPIILIIFKFMFPGAFMFGFKPIGSEVLIYILSPMMMITVVKSLYQRLVTTQRLSQFSSPPLYFYSSVLFWFYFSGNLFFHTSVFLVHVILSRVGTKFSR